jgi:two-component sensor histidine kinase
MESSVKKSARLLQLELLLKSHPEGMRRSDIARRLSIHRSTAGRYIDELSQYIPLWEEDYRIYVQDNYKDRQLTLTLFESMDILLSLQMLGDRMDVQNNHLITAIRKMGFSLKQLFPVIAGKMFGFADTMEESQDDNNLEYLQAFEKVTEALATESFIHIERKNRPHNRNCKTYFLPESIDAAQSGPSSRSLRITGICSTTKKRCTFFLHNVTVHDLLKKKEDVKILQKPAECPFTAPGEGDWKQSIQISLKIFDNMTLHALSGITDENILISIIDDQTYLCQIIMEDSLCLRQKLLRFGSSLQVLEPIDIREEIESEIIKMGKRYDREFRITSDRKRCIPQEAVSVPSDIATLTLRLSESNHRIKNNLASIASLISIYQAQCKDPKTLEILNEVRYKIRAICLVHEKLNPSGSGDITNMESYIRDLCSDLLSSYPVSERQIKTIIDIPSLSFPSKQGAIIGLIITELFMNSMKHAFQGISRGEIQISLTREAMENVIVFRDNGKGIDTEAERFTSSSGLDLVSLFVGQLKGRISTTTANGSEFIIRFP